MTLTNYWWLLIYLAAAGGILSYAAPKTRVPVLGEMKEVWSWPAVGILVFPYAVWAMNRTYFGDTEVYRSTFFEVPASLRQLPSYLADHTKDQGFSVLTGILKTAIGENDKMFFLIIAAVQIACVAYFFRKYSANFLFCMFMFVASTDYLSWMFNGMRQFLACCIVLLSFGPLLKKQYPLVIGLILLASTIHGSALLMLPIIFIVQGRAWNKRTLLMIAGTFFAITFIDRFTTILDAFLSETQYNDMITNDIWTNDNGTNILRVLFYSIPAALSLIGKRYVDEENSPVVNLCVNCSICTALIYLLSAFSSGIYVGRLPIYTTLQGYAVVPWLIDHVFTEDSARIIKVGLIGGFLVFFYYQMHITWGIL